jgi:hypothetical protein
MLRTDRVDITGQYPAPAATDVLVTTAIVLEFNMAMNEDTLNDYNIQLRDVNHTSVAVTLSYDAFRRRLTITPDADLNPGATYYVFVRGNERDDADTTYIGGVLSVDDEVFVGYYQTFFITEESALEAPVLTFPPDFSSVAQSEAEWDNGMFEWEQVDLYATGTTTTAVEAGAMLTDTIIINGESIVIPATTGSSSADQNAQTIIDAINASDAPVVASLTPSSLITIRHNTTGSTNKVIIEDTGTYDYGSLDTLGSYIANPLAPPANAYVITTEDVTYDIQVDIDTTFANPVFESTSVATLYITPGTLLPVNTQLYWRVRAKTSTVTSRWSNPLTFYNGTEILETSADGTPIVSPYYDPFVVESTSPENDTANNYLQTITVTFNDHVYHSSVDNNSISVVGKSLVSWDSDVGEIDGTVAISSDGKSLVFTPTISFGATITWGTVPSSWTVTKVHIYKSSSKDGLYTFLAEQADTGIGGTYTDTSVSGDDLYWYRLEFLDASDNPYPRSEPIAGRSGGFRDNQIYRVTVESDVYSSSGATTEAQGVALGSDYVFYFTTRLFPLYISLTQLEAIVGTNLLSKFSTIDIYSMMTYNSYAAYNLAWNANLDSMEYSVQQFSEVDDILGLQVRYFTCFVAYQTAADLLKREKLMSGGSGMDIQIGDMSIKDVVAAKGIIDPNIQAYITKAEECLQGFSSSFYDDVANWAVKASPFEGYFYSPYGPWESRSWWSDKYQGYPTGY